MAPRFAHPGVVPLAALGLLLTFALQLTVVAYVAHHQTVSACWKNFPIPVVGDFTEKTGGPALIGPSFVLAGIAAAQSAFLALLFVALRGNPSSLANRIVMYTCFIGVAEALLAPAMTSSDPFLYLTYSKLSFASFAAQPHAVVVPDLPLASWCARFVLPSAYGPAFILYLQALLSAAHSPIISVEFMRVANAVWFAILLALLRAAGFSRTTVSLAALNPGLLFQYIANAHNDIIACTLVIAGIVLVRRSVLLAMGAVLLAALFKLPFALIGALVFVPLASRVQRLTAAMLTIAASVGVSYLLGGPRYFEGLSFYAHLLAPGAGGLQRPAVAVALVAIGVALWWQRYSGAATYAFPALPIVELIPWYAIWALPYAVREHDHLDRFLILMPIMLLLMESGIAKSAQLCAYGLVVLAITVGIIAEIRSRRRGLFPQAGAARL